MSLQKKSYLQLLREKNTRKMDETTFKELLDAGEIDLIMADGESALTTQQLKRVKEKIQELSLIISIQKNFIENKKSVSQKLKDKVSSGFGFNKVQKEEVAPILSTPNTVLSEILKVIVKADAEKRLQADLERNLFEQKQSESEKRHKELIKALTGHFGIAEKIKQKEKLKGTFDKIAKLAIFVPVLPKILKRIPTRPPAPATPAPRPPTTPAPPATPPAAPPATPPAAPPATPPAAPPATPPAAPTPTPAEIARQQAARRAAEEAARRAAERSKEQAAKEGFRKTERDAERAAAEKAATERAQREAAERAQREAAERAQREAAERAQREAAERAAREEAARRTAEAQRRRDTRETDQEEAAKEAAKSAERIAREQAVRRAAEAQRRRDVRETESEELAKEAAKSAERIARQRQQQQQQPTARPEAPSVPPATVSRLPEISAATTGLVPLLAKAESADYNQLVYPYPGRGAPSKAKLTSMTIKEVMELQKSMRESKNYPSDAIGKYQIIGATLKGGVEYLGLQMSDLFNEKNQDRLYYEYLTGAKRPRLRDYLTGKVPDTQENLEKAQLDLAKEFASFGVPYDVWRPEAKNRNGKVIWDGRMIKKGQSYYTGDSTGVNKASVTPEISAKALKEERELRKTRQRNLPTLTPQGRENISFLDQYLLNEDFQTFTMQNNLYQPENYTSISINENVEFKNKISSFYDKPIMFQVGNFINLHQSDMNLYQKKISPTVKS